MEPILEGIVAYAAYTQDMDKSRSKYFSIYATWNDGCKTSYGKVSE
jgi:hypothetical protein